VGVLQGRSFTRERESVGRGLRSRGWSKNRREERKEPKNGPIVPSEGGKKQKDAVARNAA